MNYVRDVIHRLRAGETERRISLDLGISRPTVHKYHMLARASGFLDAGRSLSDDAVLGSVLGEPARPPRAESGVEPYAEIVQLLPGQKVEMTAIYQRLRDDYGYRGSYSSLRRYVHRVCPVEPEVVMRVHVAAGEEAQVDFGPVGRLFDPVRGEARTAYVFVATLSYSRHQYAELVFDQKVPTWIALHRRPVRLGAREMAGIARHFGRSHEAATYLQHAERMAQTVLRHGWDGEWFLRAYDRFGAKVGSRECQEGQIFVEPQGICVMAGIGVAEGSALPSPCQDPADQPATYVLPLASTRMPLPLSSAFEP